MPIPELESFFKTTEDPKSIKLTKTVTLNNTDTFINTCMIRIRNGRKGDLDKCPVYWHIMELVEYLKGSFTHS